MSAAIRAQKQSKLDLRMVPGHARASIIFRATRRTLRYLCSSTAATGNAMRRSAFFVATGHAQGINVAVPGYTLAPDARLTDIVVEIRQALTYLHERAPASWLQSR